MGSGVSSKPGISYDSERLGEPGDPGVPTGDQYPTNERDNITDRDAGSLGGLAQDVSTSDVAASRHVATSDDPYSHEDADQQQAEKHSAG
jgi:hypothetical protein